MTPVCRQDRQETLRTLIASIPVQQGPRSEIMSQIMQAWPVAIPGAPKADLA